ncbi:MAG: alkyl sulfatase dimerization domain-containing protein [Phenylobacterium sp.]
MAKAKGVLAGQMAGETIGEGLFVLPGQGNSLAVSTGDGIIVLDASGHAHAPGMIADLRERTEAPVHAIVYSHGHNGYNASVDLWDAHNRERGEPAARRIAHRLLPARYARYRETFELQARMAAMQFPTKRTLDEVGAGFGLHDPTETFDDVITVTTNGRRVELIHAPSEVDDAIALWLPDDGLLAAGAATPGTTIPNIGTPLRTQRYTMRWAVTLERLAALEAERLLTEFGPLIEGRAAVRDWLIRTADALRWLREEVVRRLNAGMNEREILADMTYPDAIFDQPWMQPTYGAPEYIVRDLYREENGWWDRNPTSLHPASEADTAQAVWSAIEPDQVLARARERAAAGEAQLALHVVDLIAAGPASDPRVAEARALKAELCRSLAQTTTAFVSRSLYRTSANLLDQGASSWTALK